jgi:hypothetical protein
MPPRPAVACFGAECPGAGAAAAVTDFRFERAVAGICAFQILQVIVDDPGEIIDNICRHQVAWMTVGRDRSADGLQATLGAKRQPVALLRLPLPVLEAWTENSESAFTGLASARPKRSESLRQALLSRHAEQVRFTADQNLVAHWHGRADDGLFHVVFRQQCELPVRDAGDKDDSVFARSEQLIARDQR